VSDISIRTRYTYGGDDAGWLADGGEDLEVAESITLKRSLWDLVTNFPNGFIPSGVTLGKVTASGLYGPYDDTAVDGRQTAVGFLAWPVPYDRNSTGDIGAALLWRGAVVVAKLPAHHGLDAAGQTDLAAKFRFI